MIPVDIGSTLLMVRFTVQKRQERTLSGVQFMIAGFREAVLTATLGCQYLVLIHSRRTAAATPRASKAEACIARTGLMFMQ